MFIPFTLLNLILFKNYSVRYEINITACLKNLQDYFGAVFNFSSIFLVKSIS